MSMYEYFKDIFTGALIPIAAVYLGAKVTRNIAEEAQKRNETIQKQKILSLMRHEISSFLKHYEEKQTYRSRVFVSGDLLINSTLFTIQDHEDLIQGTLDAIREFEALKIAIESLPAMVNPLISAMIDQQYTESGIFSTFKKLLSPNIPQSESMTLIDKFSEEVIRQSSEKIYNELKKLLEVVDKYFLN
ncbi:hypothetical protein [Paenibacillus oleatilyticus]|uniref:hypothetical protein n=1 Tax=Paenibacillus oleatilyticus TaxID=2594886 RepID=UPI001C1FE5E7|nr:hypothetical protein [Paenibacillus oleatilyticus]MBU7320549.1 hypothetical protein [Paenibacillus oleatilyticus]